MPARLTANVAHGHSPGRRGQRLAEAARASDPDGAAREHGEHADVRHGHRPERRHGGASLIATGRRMCSPYRSARFRGPFRCAAHTVARAALTGSDALLETVVRRVARAWIRARVIQPEEDAHARGRLQRRPVQVDGRPGGARPQPLASGRPARGVGDARQRVPRGVPRVDGRAARQQRLRQRRPRRRPDGLPHAQRPDRGPGRRARRPARGGHPRPRPLPAAAGVRRRAGPGLGVHRRVREGQRRRLPDRPLPRRLQGDLGLPRPGRDVAPPPGRALHRASRTRACSGPRRRPSCWRSGTGASRR